MRHVTRGATQHKHTRKHNETTWTPPYGAGPFALPVWSTAVAAGPKKVNGRYHPDTVRWSMDNAQKRRAMGMLECSGAWA